MDRGRKAVTRDMEGAYTEFCSFGDAINSLLVLYSFNLQHQIFIALLSGGVSQDCDKLCPDTIPRTFSLYHHKDFRWTREVILVNSTRIILILPKNQRKF